MKLKNYLLKKNSAGNYSVFNIDKTWKTTLFSLLLYKLLLDITCYFIISKYFTSTSMGFYLDFNVYKYILSWVLFSIISIFFALLNYKRIHELFLLILIVNMYAPTLVIYAIENKNSLFVYTFSFIVLFIIITLSSFYKVRAPIKPIRNSMNVLFFVVFTLIGVILLFGTKNFRGFNFNLSNVYSIRKIYAIEYPTFFYYLADWAFDVVIPFLLLYFYLRKKYVYLLFTLVLWLMLFSLTGFKSVFFSAFFVFLIYIFLRTNKLRFFYSVFHSVIIIVSIIPFIFNHKLYWVSLLVRRYLLVPAANYFNYVEFFSIHPKLLLSYSIFKNFFIYKYSLSPPHLIGLYYYNNSHMGANTGFIADAFANFGYLGMFWFSFLLIIIVIFIGFITYDKSIYLVASLFVMPFMSLVNSALLTVLWTHGLLFAMLLAFLLNKKTNIPNISYPINYYEKGNWHNV